MHTEAWQMQSRRVPKFGLPRHGDGQPCRRQYHGGGAGGPPAGRGAKSAAWPTPAAWLARSMRKPSESPHIKRNV